MNNFVNYQKELEKICRQAKEQGLRYKLLLHSCCAPCSSYCLVYLRPYFDITCLYYNPNITDKAEYELRVNELYRLVDELNRDPVYIEYGDNGTAYLKEADSNYLDSVGKIEVINGAYEPDVFFEIVKSNNLMNEAEGGRRCEACFDLRLREAARVAGEGGYDFFTTSLTISPLKNAELLNRTGYNLENIMQCGARWLPSDFKKKNGYLLSVELCKRYEMYRQNYCGCVYSMRDENV